MKLKKHLLAMIAHSSLLLIAGAACISGIPANAQVPFYEIEHITQETGMPAQRVFDLHEDEMGFLWLGTERGLLRYDGISFKVFNVVTGDSLDIQRNIIIDIQPDAEGNLWMATEAGVSFFDINTERFDYIDHEYTSTIIQSKKNPDILWALSINSLNKVHRSANSLEVIESTKNRAGRGFASTVLGQHAAVEDRIGNVWFAQTFGLWQYDPRLDTIRSFVPDPRFPTFRQKDWPMNNTNLIGPLLLSTSEEDEIWMGGRGGLHRFDLSTYTFTNHTNNSPVIADEGSSQVVEIHIGKSGTNYVGFRGRKSGLYRFDPVANTFDLITETTRSSYTNKVHESRHGVTWVANKCLALGSTSVYRSVFPTLVS